ncbi:MAG TPA: hypothetical protein VNI01_15545 [Elusimicrobiota bacterium]|jgi:hypothetical protein|nr:hypothetical protein [Elusimicrobiota bacterium]
MKALTRVVRVLVDGIDAGAVRIAPKASERIKFLAACRLPGVLERLRREGVAACEYDKATFNILTRPPEDFPIDQTFSPAAAWTFDPGILGIPRAQGGCGLL